jgi:hypothetical protein
MGDFVAIFINQTVHPHIIHTDSNDALVYSYFDGANWDSGVIAYRKRGGQYTSIAIDRNDQPHIGFEYDSHLFYSFKLPEGWQIRTNGLDCDGHVSTDFDSHDVAHISYTDHVYLEGWSGSVPVVKYATFNGSSWTDREIATVLWANLRLKHTSIEIDRLDQPHIAYHIPQDNDLAYTHRDGSEWLGERVDQDEAGFYTTLEIDADDNPHFGYIGHGNPKHTYPDGEQWQAQIVDDAGAYSSFALDSQDLPHFSYSEGNSRDLTYAHFDGTDWQIAVVDSQSQCHDTSLALDSEDRPHIAYYADNSLRYAHFDGSEWLTETVDADGDVGEYVSIAIDGLDQPHISYYDAGNWDPKYAFLPWTASNSPPVFTSTPITGAVRDVAYGYQVTAHDPDLNHGDTLTITSDSLTAWLHLTDNGDGTALLSGTPGREDVGEHAVELLVTDSLGLTDTQSFIIRVTGSSDIFIPMITRE